MKEENKKGLFEFMIGYSSWADDSSDGVWLAINEEACNEYNKQFGTKYDFHDILQDYIEHCNEANQ